LVHAETERPTVKGFSRFIRGQICPVIFKARRGDIRRIADDRVDRIFESKIFKRPEQIAFVNRYTVRKIISGDVPDRQVDATLQNINRMYF